MTLIESFTRWCTANGYFPEPPVYIRDHEPLNPQCARLVRLHSHIDEKAGNEQHYVLEVRFGASEIMYPLGHMRRDVDSMTTAMATSQEVQ